LAIPMFIVRRMKAIGRAVSTHMIFWRLLRPPDSLTLNGQSGLRRTRNTGRTRI